uniref:Glutathione S-transferase kappa 1 n=1 Tax=Sinocyclocheilus grahami TaxID=75366 RepID=A0A672LJH6_SINGR
MFSSGKVVELFYDVVSPYSWLAFEMLCRYRNVWNIDLKFKPAYLAGVIYGSDCCYNIKNDILVLLSESTSLLFSFFLLLSIAFIDTLNAMRFVTAVAEKEKEGGVKWRTHQDITQPASLTEAGLKAGLSDNVVEEIVNLSTSQPIRDKLKSVTLEALKHKCFGFPFIVCHVNGKVKVFFASDRFELMAYFIGNYN